MFLNLSLTVKYLKNFCVWHKNRTVCLVLETSFKYQAGLPSGHLRAIIKPTVGGIQIVTVCWSLIFRPLLFVTGDKRCQYLTLPTPIGGGGGGIVGATLGSLIPSTSRSFILISIDRNMSMSSTAFLLTMSRRRRALMASHQ